MNTNIWGNFVVSFQTTTISFLQLILIWEWNINKIYVYISNLKSHGHFHQKVWPNFLPCFQFFINIIIKNVPEQHLSNFLSPVLNKFARIAHNCWVVELRRIKGNLVAVNCRFWQKLCKNYGFWGVFHEILFENYIRYTLRT